MDAHACLDRDDVGADRIDPQRGGDPGDHVLGRQVAVREQHLHQGLSSLGVAELVAGGSPERVVRLREQDLDQDDRAGQNQVAGRVLVLAALGASLARFDTEIEVIGPAALRAAFTDPAGRATRGQAQRLNVAT
jgi:hypothetical protein